ncbi:MAG: SHOCT domain-containing protein, partial [Solirubrobacteraceae bacterium]
VVTNIQDAGTTINNNPRVKLTLNVQPEGGEPFDVTKKVTVSRVNLPRVGDPLRVKYYANAPEGLAVQKRTPEDLAAAAAAFAAPAAAAAPAPAIDPLDRIRKLNDLRQQGALSEAEFEAQKAKILG